VGAADVGRNSIAACRLGHAAGNFEVIGNLNYCELNFTSALVFLAGLWHIE
jgi:hypothetical protein